MAQMEIASRESTIAIGFSFPIICAILIGLRFYTRWHQGAERQIDDWLCIPAWICLTGCCVCLLVGIFRDAFRDLPISTPEQKTPAQVLLAQVVFALIKIWVVANLCVKLVILCFYRRIFVGRMFNICTWLLIGLSVIWAIYAFIASVLYCGVRVDANAEGGWAVCPLWGFGIQMGTFVFDSFIDFCLILLPIPFVWKLQLTRSKKLLILMLFLIGGFGFVAGLNNTIIQLVELLQPAIAEKGDFFQGSWLLFYNWCVIEIGVGLIACNLPVISYRAFYSIIKRIRSGLVQSVSRATNHNTTPKPPNDHDLLEKGSTSTSLPWFRSNETSLKSTDKRGSVSLDPEIPPTEKDLRGPLGVDMGIDHEPTCRYNLEPTDDRNGTIIPSREH